MATTWIPAAWQRCCNKGMPPIHTEQESGTRRNKQGGIFIMGRPCPAR